MTVPVVSVRYREGAIAKIVARATVRVTGIDPAVMIVRSPDREGGALEVGVRLVVRSDPPPVQIVADVARVVRAALDDVDEDGAHVEITVVDVAR